MSNFKNPFLSANDNFLMKKNYNVIYPSSTNQSYNSTSTFHSSNNYQNSGMKSIADQKVQDLLKQNPFQSKQNRQRQKYNYSNNSPIITQKNLYSKSKDNKIQTFRSSSLNNNNFSLSNSRANRALQVSNTSIQSRIDLKNNHYSYYSSNNNDWNSQKWKKQLQKKDRRDLQMYGPQALRYKKLDYKTEQYLPYSKDLNNEYYSINHLPSIQDHENIRETPAFPKYQHQNKKSKQIFEEDDFVIQKKTNNIKRYPSQPLFKNNNSSQSSESLYNKINKIRQQNGQRMMNSIKENQFQNLQSKIGQFNMASRLEQTSKHSEDYSMEKSQYDMYKSKCQGSQNQNVRPLNMNAFDSQIQKNMGESSVFKTKKYYAAKTDSYSQSDDYKLIKVLKPNHKKKHVGFLQTESNLKRSSIQYQNKDTPVRQNKNHPKIIKFRDQEFFKIQLTN